MTISITIPSHCKELAAAIGKALKDWGEGAAVATELTAAPVAAALEKAVGVAADLAAPYGDFAENLVQTAAANLGIPTEDLNATVEAVDTAGTLDPGTAIIGPDTTRRDEKGVAFNAMYCATAADPFYKSGKEKGQWKRKKGMDQSAYDEWYKSVLSAETPAPVVDTVIDTGAAFGQQPEAAPVPENLGELMQWVSTKQSAGLITQPDVDAAYLTAGTNLMECVTAGTAAASVARVHAVLVAKVGV